MRGRTARGQGSSLPAWAAMPPCNPGDRCSLRRKTPLSGETGRESGCAPPMAAAPGALRRARPTPPPPTPPPPHPPPRAPPPRLPPDAGNARVVGVFLIEPSPAHIHDPCRHVGLLHRDAPECALHETDPYRQAEPAARL